MTNITRYYGISGPVEFLDVAISKDNRLFVDPRAVRLQSGPGVFASQANVCTSTFFDEITRCVLSGNQSDADRGLHLLKQFEEPRETRLGWSKDGINGHGGAEVVGQAIWDALSTNAKALLAVGVLKLIEDVPVFVEDVAEDRTSDLTTRIIFEPLARFTQAMVAKHPEFTNGRNTTQSVDRQVWDSQALQWKEMALDLPVPDEEPLVLVPRDWARPRLLMSSGRYYETTMLSFVQDERAVVDSGTGKVLKEPKWSLERRKEFARGVETIVRVTRGAQDQQEDLLAKFRDFVDRRYKPLDDADIERRTR